MRQIHRSFELKGPGSVTLVACEAEDMWHIFNLIRVGDFVRSQTFRKVVNESVTGSTTSQRTQVRLTIEVEKIDFDPGDATLHVNGRNREENAYVKLGAYHTLDIEPNRQFTLTKSEWDSVDIDRLNLALDPAATADVAIVVMHEGLANVCLLTPAMTLVRAKIDVAIPRKRQNFISQYNKGLVRFFDAVAAAFIKHIDFNVVKSVLIGGRGFLNQQFFNHLVKFAADQGCPLSSEQKSRVILTHASSGFKHAIKEILDDAEVSARLSDTKAQGEVRALKMFMDLMATEPDRAFYGYDHVAKANNENVIDVLLLSDSLFRSQEIETRKKYVDLVDRARENGVTVHIFSSMHISGEQLEQITGCAAILRFAMPDLVGDEVDKV